MDGFRSPTRRAAEGAAEPETAAKPSTGLNACRARGTPRGHFIRVILPLGRLVVCRRVSS